MEQEVLFFITYQEEEWSFTLLQYDTVGDLKNEIHKKSGIAPYKQTISNWHKQPRTDYDTLITCCLPNKCNYLVVHNVEDSHTSTDRNFTLPGSNNEEYVPQDTEVSSILSFKEYFLSNFDSTGITFPECTLKEAFDKKIFTGANERQIVILYLHNKNDEFAKVFCQKLTTPNVQRILNSKFFLLCWNIENDEYRLGLIRALQQYEELRSFDKYIEGKISSALVIVPSKNSIMITNVLRGKLSTIDFIATLENAKEIFSLEESKESSELHKIGPQEYQQLMLDMLGDRDYDSFEPNEHEHLKSDIGYALFGPPIKEEGYDVKQKEKINSLFEKILNENNLVAKWRDRVIISTIYVCIVPLEEEKKSRAKKYLGYDPYTDLTPTPVFVLRKCKNSNYPCRVFIDDIGRVYTSWKSYLENNKLPKCWMVFPENGRYEANDNGEVLLEGRLSPACDISNSILKGTDIASAVGGIASGGVMVAASAIPAVAAAPLVVPVAGIAGIAIGAYSLVRSASVIFDRNRHRESLSFFESPEARGAYINIVAGSLGFVGTGANLVVSKLAAEGFNIGRGATAAVNTLNVVNIGAGGVGIANAGYDVIWNWITEKEQPSLLTIVQLSSSILFFGHAVYNYRSVNAVIEESQTNRLQEYSESLRSNRHRKTLNKLVKETIRQNDGNVNRGRAEVISSLKNIQNKDETFAFLTRSNKAMNKNNVRFAAQNGEITLNGVKIDMVEFSNMQKNEVITFLTQLPNRPNPSQANIKTMTNYVSTQFDGIPLHEIAQLGFNLAKLFLDTEKTIVEKVIKAAATIIRALVGDPLDYLKILDSIFPNHSKYFRIVGMVNSHFQMLINIIDKKYQHWLITRNPNDAEPYFVGLAINAAERATQMFEIVTKTYFVGTELTQFGIEKLLEYFHTWIALQISEYEKREEQRQQRRAHSQNAAPKQDCPNCGGKFYSNE